jgi:hypothetical protein
MPVFDFGQPEGGVIQTAFITADIHRSMREMSAALGIGPWFLFEDFELQELRYRGAPADFRVTLALGNSGHMQFELIQPLDDKPSVYTEVQRARGWGFHHYGIGVSDYDAACRRFEAAGHAQALSARVGIGARAAYYDTREALSGMVELIEMTPAVEALWTTIRHASVGWNGKEPVRRPG